MGNSQTKESRDPSSQGSHGERATGGQVYSSRNGNSRSSRHDLAFLGLGGSSTDRDAPEPRRETKQEREARKLEKERIAREKERERSMREEHVDGGYLVTQGVYTGTEDFSKTMVRQLMIERRMAPFWRGLEDFKETWTEHQLVAAARGLPIPAADEIPPEEEKPEPTGRNQHNLMVPISGRSASYGSDMSTTLSPSNPAFSPPTSGSPLISPSSINTAGSSSLFRPRSKTLASLTTSAKNTSQEQLVPREMQLPKDPYVNGQKIEAFLYKDAIDCPICFIYYPPHLNKTRCCDQPICSECFVQIKRPDPHPPEHADPSQPPPEVTPEDSESLVSEPATCPYCQQDEFGVTYDPPAFRRGLTYANAGFGTPLDSPSISTSPPVSGSSTSMSIPPRRRNASLSADAATVITTDRIRPDWATKLANARNHAARRAAAATALHTAAYLMGDRSAGDGRGLRSRFGRARDSPTGSGSVTPADREARMQQLQSALADARSRDPQPNRSGRRIRMDDLEDMMMMEAIRLSLAEEEGRKKKEEKAAAKEAKKREKENKKAEKKATKSMYSAAGSSASGSMLSLALPGRKRGNSGSSALMREVTNKSVASTDKGKMVDRGESGHTSPIAIASMSSVAGRNIDNGLAVPSDSFSPSPTTATIPDKPSHLRQMSNASSPASSFVESAPGSLQNGHAFRSGSISSMDSPNASGTHIARSNDESGTGTPSLQPMFNFTSLAAMIDREDEKEKTEHLEYGNNSRGHRRGESSASAFETTDEPYTQSLLGQSMSTIKPDIDEDIYGIEEIEGQPPQARITHLDAPELMITPVTPAATENEGKQLGEGMKFGTQEVRHFTS